MTIILATTNKKKIEEIRFVMSDLEVEWQSLDDYVDSPEIEEDGSTFDENALKKARGIAEFTGLWALADDSGLEIDALGGMPGIYSARYAGHEHHDEANIRKVLDDMRHVPERQRAARFRCTLALVDPNSSNHEYMFHGTLEGIIGHSPAGNFGFGYDPVFFVPEYGKMLAELAPSIKNKISHRAKALEQFRDFLTKRKDL